MGRVRRWKDNAERQRKYRERREARIARIENEKNSSITVANSYVSQEFVDKIMEAGKAGE